MGMAGGNGGGDDTSEDLEEKQTRLCGALLFLVALPPALFFLYILSPLPVLFTVKHFGHRYYPQPLVRFYQPFNWAYHHTRLRGAVGAYWRFIRLQ